MTRRAGVDRVMTDIGDSGLYSLGIIELLKILV